MPELTSGQNHCPTLTNPLRSRYLLKEDREAEEEMPAKPYLRVEDVAERFGVNVTTVYRLVKRGRLPAFKVGNQWRFSEARLEEWVADRELVG